MVDTLEIAYDQLKPILDELNDLRTFVWLVAEEAYADDFNFRIFGDTVSALLRDAFDV